MCIRITDLRRATFAAVCLGLLGCQPDGSDTKPADTVLSGGKIYTLDADEPWVEAIALEDGLIAFLGSSDGASELIGPDTRVVELDGRMVMPGIIDGHVHPLRGAVKELYHCSFPFTAAPEEVQNTVARCLVEQQEASWIVGGQWDSGFFERFELESPKRFLDQIAPDKPVLLKDDSLHNAWVNTKALEAAGITVATPDPEGGRILRDADGAPNGVLLETAAKMMNRFVPEYTTAQQVAAAQEFSRIANAYGITGAKAASTYEHEIAALHAADKAGQLNVHVAVSMRTVDGARSQPLDLDVLETKRRKYASAHVHTDFVKIFLDGVPTPARTAAMLAPYTPDPKTGERTDGGPLLVPIKPLAQDLAELDKRGFTVKMHAAGDRSVRVALDAIQATREANGDSGLRHELAHAGYVDSADIPRFGELNAVADLSPVIWYPSPIIDAVISAVGEERGPKYWPVRDFIDAGAPLLAGSDWPAAVPDANPWTGIEALISRRDPSGAAPAALWPEQAITLEEALAIYTMSGARALRMENQIGSLEVGKSADLIVLDRNLFEVPVQDIGGTRVDMTFFEGRLVHER